MDKKTTEFYIRLKEELNSVNKVWPSKYLYKFIVPTDTDKIHAVEKAFDRMGAIIDTRQSKNGKFTSVSVDVIMPNADEIIKNIRKFQLLKV